MWNDLTRSYWNSYVYSHGRPGSHWPFLNMVTGKNTRDYTVLSNQKQIDYDTYLKEGNLRAYNDWQKNVGSKGRSIRYPELSYPGAIYRADTGIARSLYNSYSADSNYYGNLPYRAVGLYGIVGRATRAL